MSPTLDQPQGFVSSLKSPLVSVHDMIDQLQSNWDAIYIGGGATSIYNHHSFW